jgi:hypothetical protein
MADLEVYVLLGQGPWRIIHNVFEALQTLIELLLLLVDDAQAEVDFVGFFKVGRHAHDLRKGLFGVIQRSVTIVENPDSIPQPRLLFGESVHVCKSWPVVPNTNLGVPEMVQGLLVGRIGFLKIVHHQMAVAFQAVSIGCNARIMEPDNLPRLPQVSPLWGSSFRMFWRYSMALGNCSRVRRICEMAVMPGMDHWLCRSACSYAVIAPSRSPINSVKLPTPAHEPRPIDAIG